MARYYRLVLILVVAFGVTPFLDASKDDKEVVIDCQSPYLGGRHKEICENLSNKIDATSPAFVAANKTTVPLEADTNPKAERPEAKDQAVIE